MGGWAYQQGSGLLLPTLMNARQAVQLGSTELVQVRANQVRRAQPLVTKLRLKAGRRCRALLEGGLQLLNTPRLLLHLQSQGLKPRPLQATSQALGVPLERVSIPTTKVEQAAHLAVSLLASGGGGAPRLL